MHISRHHKNWFTVIEVLVALVATGIWVLAIMGAIQTATRTMTMTRSQVVAINLAREWIEAVFNKRDTNRQLFPSKKDQCRLANSTSSTGTNCENDARLGSKSWPDWWAFTTATTNQPLLRSMTSQDNTQVNWPFKFHPVIFVNSLAWFTGKNYNPIKNFTLVGNVASNLPCWMWLQGNIKNELQVCLVNGKRWPCGTLDSSCAWTAATGAQINTKYGQFRRYITTQGIINKNDNADFSNDCVSGWADSKCADGSPKELRFCSIVDYIVDSSARRVELCSVITNFAK